MTQIADITINDLLAQKHLNVSQRRKGPHMVDIELAKLGLERDIALRAQHLHLQQFLMAMNMLLMVKSGGHQAQVTQDVNFLFLCV